jgi:GPH family glycoside/pentoside/hexuronide:cation symporter
VSLAREELRFGTKLAFSGQAFFAAAMGLTIAVFLPKFYTDVVLLPAGLLAISVAVARAFDAITDPVMGFVSDHTRTRWGRRKPWIAVGVAGNAIAYYLLFTPPGSGAQTAAWFVSCFVLAFVFTTITAIPRAALAVELTLEGRQRSALFAMMVFFLALGLVVGSVLPAVLGGIGGPQARVRMGQLAFAYVVGYLLTNAWFLRGVPERKDFLERGHNPFVPGVRRALRSKPFRIMFVSHVITSVPFAIPATLMPYYVQYVMKSERTTQWTGALLLAYLVSGFLFLPVWVRIANKIGRLRVWLLVSFIGVTGGAAWFFIGPGDEWRALGLELYVGMQASVWYFLGGTMHADIVDYDELHTGKRREAQFAAYWTIIPKLALVLGASVPLAVLSAVGYVPNREQTPDVVMALRVLFALVPALFNALGLSLMWWYPLSERAHEQIREGILLHQRGEAALDPITGQRLAPPSARPVDEAVGWRLDYFSKRELRHLLDGNARRIVASVLACLAVAGIPCACFVWLAAREVRSSTGAPGVSATLFVVAAGLSFAAFLFHLLRLRPAFGLERDPVAASAVREHLASLAIEPPAMLADKAAKVPLS